MNPSSLYEMRHSIVQAVSDYVDIEAEELVEVGSCYIAEISRAQQRLGSVAGCRPYCRSAI